MKERLLALLRVPERPDPPPGAGEALETFRAAPGFFYYSALAWIPKQAAALAGLLFSLSFFGSFDNQRVDILKAEGWDWFAEKLGGADIGLGPLHFELGSIFLLFEIVAIAAWLVQLVFTTSASSAGDLHCIPFPLQSRGHNHKGRPLLPSRQHEGLCLRSRRHFQRS